MVLYGSIYLSMPLLDGFVAEGPGDELPVISDVRTGEADVRFIADARPYVGDSVVSATEDAEAKSALTALARSVLMLSRRAVNVWRHGTLYSGSRNLTNSWNASSSTRDSGSIFETMNFVSSSFAFSCRASENLRAPNSRVGCDVFDVDGVDEDVDDELGFGAFKTRG